MLLGYKYIFNDWRKRKIYFMGKRKISMSSIQQYNGFKLAVKNLLSKIGLSGVVDCM